MLHVADVVEEPVAVAHLDELLTDQTLEGGADLGASGAPLAQTADEEVNVSHVGVHGAQLIDGGGFHQLVQVAPACDSDVGAGAQHVDVRRDAVVAPPLDVERNQIQAEPEVGGEQLLVNAADDIRVERFRPARHERARVIHEALGHHGRVKERPGDVDGARDSALCVDQMVHVAQQRVAEPERGCGELVRCRRVYGRVVCVVGETLA